MEKRRWPPELGFDPQEMTLEKALKMVDGAKEKARAMRLSMTIAVCDTGGNLVTLQRMDNCALLGLEVAVNKARTSVFGMIPTHQWGPFFKSPEQKIAPLWFHSGWITFLGGFPIILNAKIIGGIGVSGATWEDSVVARAGLKALGADLTEIDVCLKDIGVTPEKW